MFFLDKQGAEVTVCSDTDFLRKLVAAVGGKMTWSKTGDSLQSLQSKDLYKCTQWQSSKTMSSRQLRYINYHSDGAYDEKGIKHLWKWSIALEIWTG